MLFFNLHNTFNSYDNQKRICFRKISTFENYCTNKFIHSVYDIKIYFHNFYARLDLSMKIPEYVSMYIIYLAYSK